VLIDLGEYEGGTVPGTGVTPAVEEPPISRRRSYMHMSSMFSEGTRRHSFSCVPNSTTLSQSLPESGSFDGVRRGSVEVTGPGGSYSMGSNMGSSSSSVKLSENPMKVKKCSIISSPNSPMPTPFPKGTSNSGGVIPARGDGTSRQSSLSRIRNRIHFDSSEKKSKKIKRNREIKRKRKVLTLYRALNRIIKNCVLFIDI
jgi:hypothetical protein